MYIVMITINDEEELYESWGPFESVHQAAEWAGENLTTWWWVMRVKNPW